MQKSKVNEDSQAMATDSLLLFFSALMQVGLCLTIVGLLPVAILIFGLVLALKSGKIDFVQRTTRFVKTTGFAVALVCFAGVLYSQMQMEKIEVPADPDTDPRFDESEKTISQVITENPDVIFQK